MSLKDGMMQLFAQIAVNVPSVTGVFDYALPPGLGEKIGVQSKRGPGL